MKKTADNIISDYKSLFESAPGLYLVLSPELKIVAVSNAYLKATMTKREEIIGRGIFDVFPDNPDDPNATGVGNLHASLKRVVLKKASDAMAVQKYDIPRPETEGGGFEVRYWSPLNSPVLGKNNEVEYIIHQVEDVTEFIRLKQEGIEQNKLTEDLKMHAERMEAEIFFRAQQIQEANKKLREAEGMKNLFLANMSHEIRTPMNAIIGFTELLNKTKLDSKQKEFISSIEESGQNLLGIINDILDFSKIEAGMIKFENVPFSIRGLIDSVHRLLENKAEVKNINFVTHCDNKISELITGDPTRLTQVLVNLISNGIKFTEKGFVKLEVRMKEEDENYETIEFKVSDSGIGISGKKKETIFERFIQASSDTTRQYGGTGLGLSIVKNLVELQGGKITVDSKEKKGSVFTVTMPFRKLASEQLQQYIPGYADEKSTDLRGVRILLVEDNKMNQRLAFEILSGFGVITDMAENGRIAVEKFQKQTYDLILMDMQMQEMDGYKATKIIRTELKNRVPIIAMTAHALVGEKEKCLASGMNDYISKPFRTSELYEKIRSQLQLDSKSLSRRTTRRSLVNLEYLENTIGRENSRFIGEMIGIFISDVPVFMNLMKEYLLIKDYNNLGKITHKILTSVALVGMVELKEILSKMEENCNSLKELEKIPFLYSQATDLCKEVIKELEKEREKYLQLPVS